MIIIEGRKEDVAKRLKQRFEYDGSFIDRMLSVDPTGYKYVDYIAKQLEKIIPQLAGVKGGLTVDQQDAIMGILGMVIPWFHNNVNRITEDDIWKAETIFRERNGMVPNIEGIAKAFKDIIQYENPEFIRTLMEIVDSKKSSKDRERELKAQADKLYEDDDVLVIKPKTHAASCYYGANTKWCTSSTGGSGYFDKYRNMGQLYYFIKKKENIKYALFKNDEQRRVEVYNAQDKEVSLSVLIDTFPNQTDLIDELSGTCDFIKTLREFTKGKLNYRELELSDDSIRKVQPYNPAGQSEIYIEFKNDEEFFKVLDLSEDDIWFVNSMFSSYGSYDFMDSYTVDEDFKNGYIVYGELNNDNLEKLKQIAEAIIPEENFDLENEDYRIKLSDTLKVLFEDEIDYILSDYQSEKDSEMMTTAKNYISKEIETFLESIGYSLVRSFDEIKTTAANMLMWSVRLGLRKVDAISLFNRIVSESGISFGGWAENQYEFQDSENFDSEGFNRSVEYRLDKILESIEESMEKAENSLQDFLNLKSKLAKQFDFNKWYLLPKSKTVKFKIKGLDRDDMKILVELNHPEKGFKNIKLSEENFYNLLYHLELFDIFDV